MAATRLIALHINKGKTVAQCLVIPVDDHIEVNGLNVRTMKIKTE